MKKLYVIFILLFILSVKVSLSQNINWYNYYNKAIEEIHYSKNKFWIYDNAHFYCFDADLNTIVKEFNEFGRLITKPIFNTSSSSIYFTYDKNNSIFIRKILEDYSFTDIFLDNYNFNNNIIALGVDSSENTIIAIQPLNQHLNIIKFLQNKRAEFKLELNPSLVDDLFVLDSSRFIIKSKNEVWIYQDSTLIKKIDSNNIGSPNATISEIEIDKNGDIYYSLLNNGIYKSTRASNYNQSQLLINIINFENLLKFRINENNILLIYSNKLVVYNKTGQSNNVISENISEFDASTINIINNGKIIKSTFYNILIRTSSNPTWNKVFIPDNSIEFISPKNAYFDKYGNGIFLCGSQSLIFINKEFSRHTFFPSNTSEYDIEAIDYLVDSSLILFNCQNGYYKLNQNLTMDFITPNTWSNCFIANSSNIMKTDSQYIYHLINGSELKKFHLQNKSWTNLDISNLNSDILDLAVNLKGKIWLACSDGIYSNNNVTNQIKYDSIININDRVYTIKYNKVLNQLGLITRKNDSLYLVLVDLINNSKKIKLIPNIGELSNDTYSMIYDRLNNIWVATENYIHKYDNYNDTWDMTKQFNINNTPEMNAVEVNNFAVDQFNNLYIISGVNISVDIYNDNGIFLNLNLSEYHKKSMISIFPNPNSNQLLKIKSDKAIQEITIKDLYNNEIFNQSGFKSSELSIPLTESNGMYLVEIKLINNEIVYKKLIISK